MELMTIWRAINVFAFWYHGNELVFDFEGLNLKRIKWVSQEEGKVKGKSLKIPEKVDAVFFDVGNTLLRPHPSWEAVTLEVMEKFGYTASEEQLMKGMIAADRYYEERYAADDSFWGNESDTSEMWTELYVRALEEIGVDGDRKLIARAIYDRFGSGDKWRTYPDVEPVLQRLKTAGMRLALVSNWDSRLAKICFDMGLWRYLDSVLSSASIGLVKPDPRIFHVACDRLKVKPENVIHVGDLYYADILGAESAGIFPVMIDRSGLCKTSGIPVIHDLYELLELLSLENKGA